MDIKRGPRYGHFLYEHRIGSTLTFPYMYKKKRTNTYKIKKIKLFK